MTARSASSRGLIGSPVRSRRIAWVLLALLAIGTTSCRRQAPGPLECEAAGVRVLGITHRTQLNDPRLKQALDVWTVECLTTPFDRRLLRCVEETGRAQYCLADFHRRRPDLLAPEERPPSRRQR